MAKKLIKMKNELIVRGNAKLAAQYGEPVLQTGKNSIRINQLFFAGLLLAENPLRFVGRQWYEYNGKCWGPIPGSVVSRRISELLLEFAEIQDCPLFRSQLTAGLLAAIEKVAQTQAFQTTFPAMDWRLIPCSNAVLRWDERSGEFVREDYDPAQNIRSLLTVHYDSGADFAEFKRIVLDEVLGPDDGKLLQRYLGVALMPINLTENFLLLQGVGGSSKSLLVRLLAEILGDRRVFDLSTISTLGQDYALSGLDEQTLLIASESAGNALCSSGAQFIKKMVGGDKIQARLKFINEKRQLCGNYSMIIVSNEQAAFHYDGSGEEWRRRLLPIFFTKRHGKVIKGLVHQLLEQHGSGILNWLLEGATDVLRNQWQIALTPEQEMRRDRLIARSEPVRLLMESCITLSAGDEFTSEGAYKRYSELCGASDLPILTREAFFKQFAIKMQEVFPGAISSNNIRRSDGGNENKTCRGYRGYKLRERARV